MPTSGSELSNSASEGGGGTPIALLLLHECVGETMPERLIGDHLAGP